MLLWPERREARKRTRPWFQCCGELDSFVHAWVAVAGRTPTRPPARSKTLLPITVEQIVQPRVECGLRFLPLLQRRIESLQRHLRRPAVTLRPEVPLPRPERRLHSPPD